MEVCSYECAVVLDTRWEKINWMDDITSHAPSTRQLDNGEDSQTRGQARQLTRQWTGLTRAGWMTSPSTITFF